MSPSRDADDITTIGRGNFECSISSMWSCQNARIDCDALVELYLVNTSKTESKYVRELRLSAELNGATVNFEMIVIA